MTANPAQRRLRLTVPPPVVDEMQPTPLSFVKESDDTDAAVTIDPGIPIDGTGYVMPTPEQSTEPAPLEPAPEDVPEIPVLVQRVDEAVTAFIANRDVDPETASLLVALVSATQELAEAVRVTGQQQQYMMDTVTAMFEQFKDMMNNGGLLKFMGSMFGKKG